MSNLFWGSLILTGAALQILLISALLKGLYRTFPIIFCYSLVLFLSTVTDAAAFFGVGGWLQSPMRRYFWHIDAFRQFLLYSIVISLIYVSLETHARRTAVRIRLIGAAAVVAILAWVFSGGETLTFQMTTLGRNLSFCAVILNLVLWFMLIKARRADTQLLLISGGLGIQMAGEAIGQSLRQISRSTVPVGNFVLIISHLLCLLVWWNAFRSKPAEKKSLGSLTRPEPGSKLD